MLPSLRIIDNHICSARGWAKSLSVLSLAYLYLQGVFGPLGNRLVCSTRVGRSRPRILCRQNEKPVWRNRGGVFDSIL